MSIDWYIEKFACLPSTQNYLKELLFDNPDISEGTVISASHQSAGQGRHGRIWQGAEGNLFLSLLIKPKCNINQMGQISLISALAVSNVIDCDVKLKWPNDILIDGKKCCGILIDASPVKDNKIEHLIIGIGVNIKSAPLDTATFLQKYSSSEIDMDSFLDRLLSSFSDYYQRWKNEGFSALQKEWLLHTYDKGQKISVKIGGKQVKGRFDTIDMFGNLILICDKSDRQIKITSGEVFLLNDKE